MSRGMICVVLGMGLMLVSPARAARVTEGLVLGYDFREGSGTTVGDYSDNGTPLDLTIFDPGSVTWGNGSLTIDTATIISSASDANVPSEGTALKVIDAIVDTDEITIEAWVEPENDVENDGPARMATLSINSGSRNVSLLQENINYQARFRTTTAGNNGVLPLLRSLTDVDLNTPQHVVYTRNVDGDAIIYIDGGRDNEEFVDGDVTNWDDSYDFALGNELTWDNINDRDWLGTFFLVALYDRALSPDEVMENFQAGELAPVTGGGAPLLQAGDADMDLDFDQLDLVQVQIAAKYLTGQPATWGDGDWDGTTGGEPGSPPTGNGLFDQLDIIGALAPGHYLTGPYAAVVPGGSPNDGQTSVGYNATTGEVWVDAPAGKELTSINIDSAGGIFSGDPAQNLGGSFDNDADNNIFKATFGSSFSSLSFGNVAQLALSEEFVLNDLTVVGSLAGGGDLGNVDLIYVPEPSSVILLVFASLAMVGHVLRRRRDIK